MRTGVKRYCYEKKKFVKRCASIRQGLMVAGFCFQEVLDLENGTMLVFNILHLCKSSFARATEEK